MQRLRNACNLLINLPAIVSLLVLWVMLPADAQGGFVPAQNIQKGTANNQSTRWDAATGKWVANSNLTIDSAGNVVAAGTITTGGNVLSNYTLPTASSSVLGGVKVGSNLTISGGVLSGAAPYTLPAATASALGGVMVGSGLSVTGGGTLSTVNSGTVTSVGLSVPGLLYSVSGSPVTGSGTLTETLLTQTANTVLAGPSSGSAAAPTFRGLVGADLSGAGIVSNNSQVAVGGGVDTGTRLTVSPSSTSEGGVNIVLPTSSTANAFQVKAPGIGANGIGATFQGVTIDNKGDLYVSGGTNSNPVIFGGTFGSEVRCDFGDTNEGIQGGLNNRMQMFSYHGIEVYGARAGSPPSFAAGSATSDIGLNVFSSATTNVPFGVKAVSGQTGDLAEINSSTGTGGDLAKITATGGLQAAGQSAIGGGLDTGSRLIVYPQATAENGYTVNMPSGATGYALRVNNSTGGLLTEVRGDGTLVVGQGGADRSIYMGGTNGSLSWGYPTPSYSIAYSNGGLNWTNLEGVVTQFGRGGGISTYGYLATSTLSTPAGVTVTPTGTTGSTTYTYRVTAVSGTGQTLASSEVSTNTGNATLSSSNYNSINCTAVLGAEGYYIYGRTAGAEQFLGGVATFNMPYKDTGSSTPSGALPTTNTTGYINAGSGFQANGTAGLTVTVPLAKLTTGGTNGSETFTGGILTAYTAPN